MNLRTMMSRANKLVCLIESCELMGFGEDTVTMYEDLKHLETAIEIEIGNQLDDQKFEAWCAKHSVCGSGDVTHEELLEREVEFTVRLSSVIDCNDIATGVVRAVDADAAVALAMTVAGHWYTDLVSVSKHDEVIV